MASARYLVCTYRFSAEVEEAAVALLWLEGCEGLEELGSDGAFSTVEAYFPAEMGEPPRPSLAGVELLECRRLEEMDWLEEYRRHAQPLAVGRSFLVDPREPEEPEVEAEPGRRVLRIPARQAFGTGSHESTRLILELLEEVPLTGSRVLDVGSGSGILSFAALALGARSVAGFDLDPVSAFLAGQYRRLNDLHPSFFAGRLDALEASAVFDLLLINILPERILPEVHRLPPMLRPSGEILLSGILLELAEEVLEAWRKWGFGVVDRRVEGDWVAYRCRR
ncbi:MAG: 50S ribosomal protein L11 methyltransferase [Acidobacteria bacterium]|nr:50S ribosomal protein L11 methyltransferase [Acidobacteriota bacterium]